MKLSNSKFFCTVLFVFSLNLIIAQQNFQPHKVENEKEKPIIRKLDNGFRYIIKPLSGKVQKNEVRFIVNAGKSQQGNDQFDHAHLLEHLAFNYLESYTNFKNDTELLGQLNLRQSDLHAFTFDNSTWFQFMYPSNTSIALDTIFDYAYEIASGKVVFKEDQIKAERKAVYQEYLLGNPEKSYARHKINNKLFKCNKKTPLPHQFENMIMNSTNSALKRFYNDWYRPDLMTLVAVGNFKNIDDIEKKIKKMFKDIRMTANPRKKTNCFYEYLNIPQSFMVINSLDKTKSDTDFQFRFRENSWQFKDLKRFQQLELWNLLKPIINKRLNKLGNRYNVDYAVNFQPYPNLYHNAVFIKAFSDSQESIIDVFSTLSGLSKNGITQKEYNETMNSRLGNLKQTPIFSVDYWADFYTDRVVNERNDFEPNIEDKIYFLENLDIATINNYLKVYSWMPDDIAVIIPKERDDSIYSKKEIQKKIREGLNAPTPFKEVKEPTKLLTNKEIEKFSEVEIISREKGAYGEDIIKLENGLTLVLKHNQPKGGRYKDKIKIRAFSPFGASCFGEADYEAMLSPSLIKNGGLGKYNKFEINNFLKDTSFQYGLYDYITASETGFEGALAPNDLEAFLQVIYLKFTEPRFDKEAWKDWKMEELKRFHRNSNPNNNFLDFRNQETGYYKMPQGENRYEESLKLNYRDAFKKYIRLHSNASSYTVLITGDFQEGKVLPLLRKYLGNLPNTEVISCPDKTKTTPPVQGVAHHNFSQPVDNSYLSMQFRVPYKNINYKTEIELELLKAALDVKIRRLRYNEYFGIYSAKAVKKINPERNINSIEIYLKCNKEDLKGVVNSCENFIEELRTELIDENTLQTIKNAAYLLKWDNSTKNYNNYVMKNLYGHYRYSWPIADPSEAQKYLTNFSAKDLQKAANKYFKLDYRWVLTGGPNNL